eukprot:14637602-Alexandrium_andersonii.AAC.1
MTSPPIARATSRPCALGLALGARRAPCGCEKHAFQRSATFGHGAQAETAEPLRMRHGAKQACENIATETL